MNRGPEAPRGEIHLVAQLLLLGHQALTSDPLYSARTIRIWSSSIALRPSTDRIGPDPSVPKLVRESASSCRRQEPPASLCFGGHSDRRERIVLGLSRQVLQGCPP